MARRRRIRSRVTASALATFTIAFALITESGSLGAVGTRSAVASPTGVTSTMAVEATTDSEDDPSTSAADQVSPVASGQS